MKRLFQLVLVLTMALTSCTTQTAPPGTLQGKVHIGPLTPVERPGQQPPVSPEVFAARKVMVYIKDRSKVIAQVDIKQIDQSAEGFYSIQLQPGTYTVDINRAGIDHSRDVPRQAEIKSGQTVELDIDIDTGIR